MKNLMLKIGSFLTNRLLVMFLIIFCMFYMLCTELYELQIVNGQDYQNSTKKVYSNTITVEAPRGEIFDRNGRPLAINHTTVIVKIDPTVKVANQAEVLINFVRLMNRNGEVIVDNFPISDSEPREFMFNGSKSREDLWKSNMEIDKNLSAQEAYDKLVYEKFKLPVEEKDLTPEEIRLVLSLWQDIYLQRFYKQQITVAYNVSGVTSAALEERNQDFPGIYIDVGYVREYPEGEYVSHIIGYTRKINADQLAELRPLGYNSEDVVGQIGIESTFEQILRGINGKMVVETDSSGRRIGVISNEEAVSGNNVFLTIDVELTKEIYGIVENHLANIIINKLKTNPQKSNLQDFEYISTRTLLASMISANNVSVDDIMDSDEMSLSYPIKDYVLNIQELEPEDGEEQMDIKELILDGLEKAKITENQILLAMYEQGIVTPNESELDRMKKGTLSTLDFLVKMLEEGVVTPQMTNIHPCTASVVVLDCNTGAVLASVSYPTYDNNQFVNNFNYNYYVKLLNDPTYPMLNRPFQEARAVGSTFKMITAVAALENGVVTPTAKINDERSFTKAGKPYATCTGGSSHQGLTVSGALEVSCNYYFYEVAYRLGNTKDNTKFEGIGKLNEYMAYFGLGSPTGVEIFEALDSIVERLPEGVLPISSPGYREFRERTASAKLWSDGDSIRTAIGQADNNYTPATMAKYVSTIATNGDRYKMHFLDKITAYDGRVISKYEPIIELTVPMKEENLKAVQEGMLAVTKNSRGTANKAFSDFPISVAGKTGTAQEHNWYNHTAFAGYAPYEDPQVAIYVQIPGSYQGPGTSPSAFLAKDVLAAYFGLNAEPQISQKENTLAK